jgi:hypothetical protein
MYDFEPVGTPGGGMRKMQEEILRKFVEVCEGDSTGSLVFSVDLCTNDYFKTVGPLYPQQCFLTVGDVVGDDLRCALRILSAINIKPMSLTLYWNKGKRLW